MHAEGLSSRDCRPTEKPMYVGRQSIAACIEIASGGVPLLRVLAGRREGLPALLPVAGSPSAETEKRQDEQDDDDQTDDVDDAVHEITRCEG